MCCLVRAIPHFMELCQMSMVVSRETPKTRIKTCFNTVSPTTNVTYHYQVLNKGLHGKKPVSSRLSYGMHV
jgi:hypothetical protein